MKSLLVPAKMTSLGGPMGAGLPVAIKIIVLLRSFIFFYPSYVALQIISFTTIVMPIEHTYCFMYFFSFELIFHLLVKVRSCWLSWPFLFSTSIMFSCAWGNLKEGALSWLENILPYAFPSYLPLRSPRNSSGPMCVCLIRMMLKKVLLLQVANLLDLMLA